MLKALHRAAALTLLAYCASALTEVLVHLSALRAAVERLDKPLKFSSYPITERSPDEARRKWHKDRPVSRPGGPHERHKPSSSASPATMAQPRHTQGSTGAGGRWTPTSGAPTADESSQLLRNELAKDPRIWSPTAATSTEGGSPGHAPGSLDSSEVLALTRKPERWKDMSEIDKRSFRVRAKERIEQAGYLPICIPKISDGHSCLDHDHVPGERNNP